MTSVPSTGNFALSPRRQEDDITRPAGGPSCVRRSRSSCRRFLSSPLSYGRFHVRRVEVVNGGTITTKSLREDERRVRRRHSELSRSGAPLFIPHVIPCGRYVMLLLPITPLSRANLPSASSFSNLPSGSSPFPFPIRLFLHLSVILSAGVGL